MASGPISVRAEFTNRAGGWVDQGIKIALRDAAYLAVKQTGEEWRERIWNNYARSHIDRPTPFTLNGAFATNPRPVRGGGDTARDFQVTGFESTLGLKNFAAARNKRPPAHYLSWPNRGGQRFVRLQPAGKSRDVFDSFGNIPQKMYRFVFDFVRKSLSDSAKKKGSITLLGRTFDRGQVRLIQPGSAVGGKRLAPGWSNPLRVVAVTSQGGNTKWETVATLKTRQTFRKSIEMADALSPLLALVQERFTSLLRNRLEIADRHFFGGGGGKIRALLQALPPPS